MPSSGARGLSSSSSGQGQRYVVNLDKIYNLYPNLKGGTFTIELG